MKVVLDASVLTEFLAPSAHSTDDTPYRRKVRVLADLLAGQKAMILIPTPVIAEVLVSVGPEGVGRLEIVQKTLAFRIVPFDYRSAMETAWMARAAREAGDKRAGRGSQVTWSQIKFDWQIIAVAKVHQADVIYSNDEGFCKFSNKHEMPAVYMEQFDPSDYHSDTPLFQFSRPK